MVHIDPKVFTQSKNLMYKAIDLYYVKGHAQKVIAEELNVSVSTVSRLLKRAEECGAVTIHLAPEIEQTVALEAELNRLLPIREVIVAPSDSTSPLDSRLSVALEGARHLQNTIKDGDIIGMCNGGTVRYLIQYLNPCRKVHTTFVMLHGALNSPGYQEQMQENMAAISNVFGGKKYLPGFDAYIPDGSAFEYVKAHPNTKLLQQLYEKVNVSVSGVGALYPECDSALSNPLTTGDSAVSEFLQTQKPCGDILLRFFDENGQECKVGLGVRVMAIEFDVYRKIPTKIVVAAGEKKARACIAGVRGGLIDVLIIDRPLAKKILALYKETA